MDFLKHIIMLIFIMFLIALIVSPSILIQKTKGDGCKKSGFVGYIETERIDMCKDNEGNLYYVQMDCKGMLGLTDCTAKEISVGGVRVVK